MIVHVKLWKSNAGSILSSIAYVVVSYSLDSTYCPPPLLLSSGVFDDKLYDDVTERRVGKVRN